MQSDRLSSNDSASATVIRGSGHEERVMVHGRYDAVLFGPVEHHRAEYIALRDRIAAEELIAGSAALAQLRAQLRAIPLEEKWTAVAHNLVTTVGKNDFLDKYLKGSAYTQTMRMGLKGTGTAAAGDTQASHAGWSEVGLANAPTYSGSRPSITFNSASSGSSSSPTQSFSITSSGTVAGCFMNNGGSATVDNTTGVLFSAGDFTGGSKTVGNGDTLNVTYTLSV